MKLLLITLLAFQNTLAQPKKYCFTAEQIDYNWNLTMGYKFDAEKWEKTAMLNHADLVTLSNTLAATSDSLLTAINERDELKRAHEKDAVELERLSHRKRFAVGVGPSYGFVVVDSQIQVKPSVNVSLILKLFQL